MIRIITDSTSEISPAKAKELNIDVIPLYVTFNEKTYKDKVEISNEEFYNQLINSEVLPTTSQPNPHDFYEVFSKYPNDTIIGIFLTSKLSGTFQSAVIAKEMIENNDNIHLIDAQNLTVSLTLLVNEAIKLRDSGCDAGTIINQMNKMIPHIKLLAYVDTVKYLKMGGRISSIKALLSMSFGISPIIGIEDGAIVSVAKCKSKRKANKFIKDFIERYPIDSNYDVAYAHSECIDDVNELVACLDLKEKYSINEIGPVVGTHAGPKAYGIAYITTSK